MAPEPPQPLSPFASTDELLDSMGDAFFALDAEWRFAYVNRHAEMLLRRGSGELLGRRLWDEFPATMALEYWDAYHRARSSGRIVSFVEYYPPPLEGWFSIRAMPRGAGLWVFFHEVTDLKLAELRVKELADEQQALRQVATAVAAGGDQNAVFSQITRETAQLVGAQVSGLTRFDEDTIVCVAAWGAAQRPFFQPGDVFSVLPGSEQERARRTGQPVLVEDSLHAEVRGRMAQRGYRSSLYVPILVEGRVWGTLSVAHRTPARFDQVTVERLSRFCELTALAVANADARAELATRAASDSLTGLANARAFHERLQAEVSRARRHGEPLCLAVFDVDNFKAINDGHGHAAGDRCLSLVARHIADACRAEDLAARLGGDEFAVILVDTTAEAASGAVERVRAAVADAAAASGIPVTLSAGLCDWLPERDAETVFRLADDALYWSKAHGRDRACVYDAQSIEHLDAEQRAARLRHVQAMSALRALARVIDARDPSTREHSDRVAAIAAAIARELGWSAARVDLVHEAALVHDVGKIGVPDAVLRKREPLTDEEREAVRRHATLGADIVRDVLSDQQVAWVRGHHERPDGTGYPDGLAGADVPDGAAIIAIADCWEAMTASRPYTEGRTPAEALVECRALVGRQFAAEPVAALEAIFRRRGDLGVRR